METSAVRSNLETELPVGNDVHIEGTERGRGAKKRVSPRK
jgi:hypothetical protein